MADVSDAYTLASKTFRAALTTVLRRHGLHLGQNLVLERLADTDGQTPGELATAIHVTTPTIVKMATRMASAGLLVRRRDTTDNRLVRLYLTPEGRALVGPLRADLDELEAELVTGLSAAERATLLELMARVTGNARALLDAWAVVPEEHVGHEDG
ncbi:MarR family winged helix-turn-helix transcriptional regulator [Luteimicrobium sp. NPDC057192]|uniref:MarR family winged helix-turn-helix transcriptional regulator n=1 Tax=Luteimicrobium sp. NPDC057192 TaxID=3346042 RepID=UPI00363B1CC1